MNRIIQTVLLILALSIGIALRMTIFGWLFIIGVGTILVFGISHLLIHSYTQQFLSKKKFSNIILIILSHVFFILIFLFQTDADDSKSYSIIGFITSSEKRTLIDYSLPIVLISIIGYVIISLVILIRARKAKLLKFEGSSFAISAFSSFVFIFVILNLISAKKNIDYSKQFENTGEYHSIRRALREPNKVIELKINPYETRLTEIPKEIFDFPNLKELDLTDQSITTIPETLPQAKSLEILNLIGNNIQTIPTELCECNKLRELRIGSEIRSIPECLKSMPSLKHLSIQSNEVNILMDELLTFKNIETAHFFLKDGIINGKRLDSIYKVTGIEHKY